MLAATDTTNPGGCAATGAPRATTGALKATKGAPRATRGALKARTVIPAASQFTNCMAALEVVIR